MRRKKTVFKNDQLCHVFVAQTQSEGRNSGSTLYFKGDRIYSYGSHYLLGKIVEIKGEKVVLRNEYNYSQSTAMHRHALGNAASHLRMIDLADPDDFKTSLDKQHAELGEEYFDFFTSISRGFWSGYGANERWKQFATSVHDFNELCDFLDRRTLKIKLTELHKELWKEKYTQLEKRQKELNTPEARAKREADRLKREETKDRKEAEQREKQRIEKENALVNWKSGGPYHYSLRDIRPQQLRINEGEVETTGGASVPLDEALKLLRKIQKGKVKKGERVGSFEFNRRNGDCIIVGCHEILLSEAMTVLTKAPSLQVIQGGAK